MLTGATPGHGPLAAKAVNTPVEICGMDVCPGDVIHMDENGAVRFPRKYLPQVLENCLRLYQEEAEKMAKLASTDEPDLLADYMEGNYH